MPEAVTVLKQHFSNVRQRRSDGQSFTAHAFPAEDGNKYETLQGDVAQKAADLVGKPAKIRYSVKQNGEYTNYYIDAIEATNGDDGVTPEQAAVAVNTAWKRYPQVAGSGEGASRQNSIERQNSLTNATNAALALADDNDPAVLKRLVADLFEFNLDLVQGRQEL